MGSNCENYLLFNSVLFFSNKIDPLWSSFFFFFFLLSFWTAAWVTFNEAGRLQPVLFLAATRFLECFMSITSSLDVFLPLVSFSFSIHILRIKSLFLAFTSFRSSPFRAPAHASMVVHGRALVSFPIRSIVNCFKLAPGFDLAPFWKNVDHSSPRPRCLGRCEVVRFKIQCRFEVWTFKTIRIKD